jgi:septum formation protein
MSSRCGLKARGELIGGKLLEDQCSDKPWHDGARWDNRSMNSRPSLILASTSPYRRELLARLRLPFEVQAPEVDETALDGETPVALAQRLALAKARAVAQRRPDAVVIGSDQVADMDGQALGKPGTHERAVQQLKSMRGRKVMFHTAVAVVRGRSGFEQAALCSVAVSFRELSDDDIEQLRRAGIDPLRGAGE